MIHVHSVHKVHFVHTLSALILTCSAFAADPPHPSQILATFQIHPDFQIDLVAAEPSVVSPVDVEFDERGRPFVVEMLGYPYPDEKGRIVILDDKDRDGYYETSTVFAEGFAMADSLVHYNGGVLVVSPPEILFLKDTNGDDVADVREVVFNGMLAENPQHNVNGLTYGLDNWIYAANGGNGGKVAWADGSGEVAIRDDDFRFDLRTKKLERAGRSTGGYEITFDSYGRMFGTHNLEPMNHLVFPGGYLDGVPQPAEGTLNRLPDDIENGLVRIYPIGEQDTRVNHPEQSGYFSGSCGIRSYGGGIFGPEFEDNLFVCDVVLNLIHRRILEPSGTSFTAKRDPKREKIEFLASTDRAFRPVNMTVAPDGALWVVDMHREVIEHPEWIPDEFLKTMDVNAGKEQGRLFRIAPKQRLPRRAPAFTHENLDQVVAGLEHTNQWWRMTAQRLLVEWNDPAAVPMLEKLARESASPVARVHALWTLNGMNALDDALIYGAQFDLDAHVREHSAILAAQRMGSSPDIERGLRVLAGDPAPRVRMWAALALSGKTQWKREETNAALLEVLKRGADDPFTRLAVLPGALLDSGPMLTAILANENGAIPAEGRLAMIAQLAQGAITRMDAPAVGNIVTAVTKLTPSDPRAAQAVFSGFATGLEQDKDAFDNADARKTLSDAIAPSLQTESLPVLREVWRLTRALELTEVPGQQEALARAEAAVRDEKLAPEVRVQQLQILEFAPFAQRAELLYTLLDTRQPRELQHEAAQQLQREGTNEVATRLIAMWRALGPETRPIAGNTLLYKRPNNPLLLTALEDGTISLGEMDFHLERRRVMLHSKDPEVVRRAEALFSDAGVVTRKDAMEKMKPALELKGTPAKGKVHFESLCLRCHQMAGAGGDLGPNLTEIYRKSRETLLHDILDPNAAADTKFIAYTIERKNGELVSGLIDQETDAAVTIRDANGVRTAVPRADIAEFISNGLSLMPEELETGLDPQAMADLLAYLQVRK